MLDERESVTYQAILEKGMIKANREVILDIGEARFGAPGEEIKRAVLDMTDLALLRFLARRVFFEAGGWSDLLESVPQPIICWAVSQQPEG